MDNVANIFCGLLFLLPACCLWGSTPVAETTLTVATPENTYPYSFEKDGQLQGIYVDAIRKLGLRAGFIPKFMYVPYRRTFRGLRSGDIDIGFVVARNNETLNMYKQKLNCVIDTSFLTFEVQFYVLKTNPDFQQSDVDIFSRHLGVERMSVETEKHLAKGFKRISRYNSQESLFKALYAKRIDIAALNGINFEYPAKQMGATNHRSVLTRRSNHVYLALSNKYHEDGPASLCKKVAREVETMKEAGDIEAISTGYFPQ